MQYAIILCLIGTGFMFLMTVLGSAMVFIFKSSVIDRLQSLLLGFAAGVMIAASIWSLLIPAMNVVGSQKGLIMISIGFIFGWIFIMLVDILLSYLHLNIIGNKMISGSSLKTSVFVLAVTLHNIPEGLAVGLSCGLAIEHGVKAGAASALALALGMGIQNFPEGAAISLPLKQEGMKNWKAFLFGGGSGLVEPISGVIGVLLINYISYAMPFLLSFAAGSMIYVVVEELIPKASLIRGGHKGTTGFMLGFLIMMILDVCLS